MIKQNQNNDAVIILGAGSSGLAAAYELKKRGISVRIIEKAQRPGEAWHHRHPQLRLNTHRKLSKLPGKALPKSAEAFPSRDSIILYIEDYARIDS
ncbi:MAG: FAD-dependent oxidoreductase [Proteobacteria bacterium]|nr:FAD-dependent oxidoreductase [Pseudomonadota bacterium]